MSLWKPFRGNRTALEAVEKHDGYVYFCVDDGSLFFDYTDADGVLQRKQINAKEAEALTGYSVETILNSSDTEIPTSKAVLDALSTVAIGGGAGIIDVIELPTENINEDVFYRLLTGTFVYNQFEHNGFTCYCVETLPEIGEPATTDMTTITAYYNGSDGVCYGYVDSALSSAMSVPVGWYDASVLLPAAGYAYGGVVTSLDEATLEDTFYLMLQYVIYSYKDSWTALKFIGNNGTGVNAEVFNHPANIASGDASHAEGWRTTASGHESHAEGYSTTASGENSHAEGANTTASGQSSHAEGQVAIASGYASHAEGEYTYAENSASHAEGYFSHAEGHFSHAEGEYTYAGGVGSHAEGCGHDSERTITGAANTTIYTIDSVDKLIIGTSIRYAVHDNDNNVVSYTMAKITAIDADNLTITVNRTLSADVALTNQAVSIHILGLALGDFSHSEGLRTIAAGRSQHVQGKYNIVDSEVTGSSPYGKYAHIVGNGEDSSSRSNAHTLDWSGNAWFQGNVYVGGTGQDDTNAKKIATEEYVNEKISSITESKYSQGLAYTLSDDGTYYTVSGIGTCTNTDVVIPPLYNGLPVTSIGDGAFSGCSNLTSIVIPDSVTFIGASVFFDCSSLENVTLPFIGESKKTSSDTYQYPLGYLFGASSLEAGVWRYTQQNYYGSSTSLVTSGYYLIPASLKSVTVTGGDILYGAFYNCADLTSIGIGDKVTSISSYAFYSCSGLTGVYITDLASWCNIEFGDLFANPISYAKNLYLNGKLVTELIIPYGVTSISQSLFGGCRSLANVKIPDSVTSIGIGAFQNCSSLTSVTIPDSVTSIGKGAFRGCSSLNSITIPDSVTSIGNYAFGNVDGPTSVFCKNLTSVVIGNSVTTIGEGAFAGCNNLTSINIPDSVTTIGADAFHGCSNLSIYCEVAAKPDTWDTDWNDSNRPVVWGVALDFVGVNGQLNEIKDDYVKTTDLATVATSGSYKDLTDQPNLIPHTSFGCYSPEFTIADLIAQLTNEGVTTISGQPIIVSFDGMVSGTFLCRFNSYHGNYYGCEFTDLKNLETFYFEGDSPSLSVYDNLNSAENKQLSLKDLSESGGQGCPHCLPVVNVTSTDGKAYTATVDGLTELYVGASMIIKPNKTSTTAFNVTLNVNGLGDKAIKRWDNLFTHEYWSFKNDDWLRAGYPFRILYNGTYWIIEGMNKPYASDLNGVVPVANGGVPTSSASDNGKFLRVVNGVAAWSIVPNAEGVSF